MRSLLIACPMTLFTLVAAAQMPANATKPACVELMLGK